MWAANFFHGRPVDGPEVTRPRSFPPALLRLCVGVEPQTPGHEDGFEDDLARHLRLPLAAVGEGDGHLGHGEAGAAGSPRPRFILYNGTVANPCVRPSAPAARAVAAALSPWHSHNPATFQSRGRDDRHHRTGC